MNKKYTQKGKNNANNNNRQRIWFIRAIGRYMRFDFININVTFGYVAANRVKKIEFFSLKSCDSFF